MHAFLPTGATAGSPLAAARALGPSLAERSLAIEAARRLPPDVVAELTGAGLFRLLLPLVLGGSELPLADALDVVEEVAFHDGSAGWCVMIGSTTAMVGAFLPPAHAVPMFDDPATVTGGFAAPVGRARVVDGGLSVSGRWQWGSGTSHCSWIGGGCVIVDAEGKPSPRADGLVAPFVLMPSSDVELLDTWHVSGLRGTGSTDYVADEVFVPEGRWVSLGVDRPVRGGPLYRFPFFGTLALGVASVALGLARRAIDELVALAATKKPMGSGRVLADRAQVQADVAVAEAAVASARALMAAAVDEAWAAAAASDGLGDEHRRRVRMAATHAVAESARAVDLMYTAGGGAAVYADCPLQRVFRDVHVATQHAMVAPRTNELVGRIRLGLPTDTAQL